MKNKLLWLLCRHVAYARLKCVRVYHNDNTWIAGCYWGADSEATNLLKSYLFMAPRSVHRLAGRYILESIAEHKATRLRLSKAA